MRHTLYYEIRLEKEFPLNALEEGLQDILLQSTNTEDEEFYGPGDVETVDSFDILYKKIHWLRKKSKKKFNWNTMGSRLTYFPAAKVELVVEGTTENIKQLDSYLANLSARNDFCRTPIECVRTLDKRVIDQVVLHFTTEETLHENSTAYKQSITAIAKREFPDVKQETSVIATTWAYDAPSHSYSIGTLMGEPREILLLGKILKKSTEVASIPFTKIDYSFI